MHLLFKAQVTNHRSIPFFEHTDIGFSFVAFLQDAGVPRPRFILLNHSLLLLTPNNIKVGSSKRNRFGFLRKVLESR
jgi:hypothetical protein